MAKPKAKKYLVWDFDGTLAYRTGGWSGALISVLKQVNPKSKVTIDEIRPYLQTGFPWHAPENAHPGLSTDDWWEDLKPVFMRAFRSTGVPGSKALELAGQVRSVYTDPAGWVRYDDSLPALEALSQQGWTHLLLTNHVPELLSLLDKLDLVRPFAKIFNSFNTGYEKPNPKAFRTVTDWTGANAIQWIIGDSYHSDVLGAQEFGLPALLVRVKPAEARKMGAKFYCAAVAETPRFFEDKEAPIFLLYACLARSGIIETMRFGLGLTSCRHRAFQRIRKGASMAEKSVAEKLMIKAGRRVRFVNSPADLPALLGGLPDGAVVLEESASAAQITPAEIIVLFANNRTEMIALLPGLRKALAPNGMIWVAYHKGTSTVKTDIHRDSINAYAHTLGMQAVALISVNEDWSALRLKVSDAQA